MIIISCKHIICLNLCNSFVDLCNWINNYVCSRPCEHFSMITNWMFESIVWPNNTQYKTAIIFDHPKSMSNPCPKQQILDTSKLKEFADNNYRFNENGIKFSKR